MYWRWTSMQIHTEPWGTGFASNVQLVTWRWVSIHAVSGKEKDAAFRVTFSKKSVCISTYVVNTAPFSVPVTNVLYSRGSQPHVLPSITEWTVWWFSSTNRIRFFVVWSVTGSQWRHSWEDSLTHAAIPWVQLTTCQHYPVYAQQKSLYLLISPSRI